MHGKNDGKKVNVTAPAEEGPWLGSGWSLAVIVSAELAIGAGMLRFAQPHQAMLAPLAAAPQVSVPAWTDEPSLPDADRVARWAAATGNAARRPFLIVDKANARVMAFDAQGRLAHSTPTLLGFARGDDSPAGIGTKAIADITPEERITPAGRFIARRGVNATGEDIVWVDYDAAVSMHRVRATNPAERRLERLASETIEDNRISWGCINLPVAFYEGVVRPMVDAGQTVVYVLPDTKPLTEVFALGARPRHASL